MKLAITKTFCVLISVAGLVFQPLSLIGNNISNQEPTSTDSVTISRPSPRLGVYKPVTLLVDFSDRPANSLSTRAYYQDLFFSQMGNSVTTFLKANSLDKFDCQGVVYWNATDDGWIRAPKPFSYYFTGINTAKYMEFRDDILAIVDPWIDFSQHDANHDGICDGLVFVRAGGYIQNYAISGRTNNHRDGVTIRDFCFEIEYEKNPLDKSIFIFTHEYSHLLGTYDLYDYDISSRGAGLWSFMGAYYYRHFDAFNKDLLGWLDLTTVTVNQECVLPPVESTGKAIKVPILGRPNEYFLLENRQNIGSYDWLPGYGLLIWHIDESVDTNNRNEWYPSHTNTGHYLAALEQADGLWELERNINTGNAADIYSSGCSFTPSSVPNSHAYDGKDSNLYVTNIHYESLNVVFTISFDKPPIPLSPSVREKGTDLFNFP